MTTLRSLSFLLAAAVLAAAAAPVPASAADPYPCSLISESEVAAAIGEPTLPARFTPNSDLGEKCVYMARDAKIVVLQTRDPKLIDEMGHIHAYVPVAGIGAKAYMNEGALYIRKGNKALELDIRLPDQLDALTPPATKIARTVVSRM